MRRIGNVITDLDSIPANVAAIKSWDNKGFSTKAAQFVKTSGLYHESVYSPTTQSYIVFLLTDRSKRSEAFAIAACPAQQQNNWQVR